MLEDAETERGQAGKDHLERAIPARHGASGVELVQQFFFRGRGETDACNPKIM